MASETFNSAAEFMSSKFGTLNNTLSARNAQRQKTEFQTEKGENSGTQNSGTEELSSLMA